MTKPGTIRWKVVASKKPDRARPTKDAAVRGDFFWSTATVNLPQEVVNVTAYFLFGDSGRSGGVSPPSGFAPGALTCSQPPDLSAEVTVDLAGLESPPQPALSRTSAAAN